MEQLLPDKGAKLLLHGVCSEARAALVTTLAKQNRSQTTLQKKGVKVLKDIKSIKSK